MTLYRNLLWYRKGWKEYTREGYLATKNKFDPNDLDVDCSDKVFMVTGANRGIGKCIGAEIARKAGVIHLVCRNEASAEEARKEMVETTGNPQIHYHIVDLSRPCQVAQFAKNFVEKHPTLNVLINNAGCMFNTRELTPEGIEKTFATNVLGTHILTTRLMSLLLNSPESRVIMISSGGMLVQRLNVNDLQFEKMQPYDGSMAYAQAKRQLVIMTEQYAFKYPKIHFSSVNPGWADTPGVQSASPDFYAKTKENLRTPAEAADTAVWLAVSKKALDHPSGLFFQDRHPVPTHLPLAWTRATAAEENEFMDLLDKISEKFIENQDICS